jgi:hypothetical protein
MNRHIECEFPTTPAANGCTAPIQGSKSNIPCCALLARQVRATFVYLLPFILPLAAVKKRHDLQRKALNMGDYYRISEYPDIYSAC